MAIPDSRNDREMYSWEEDLLNPNQTRRKVSALFDPSALPIPIEVSHFRSGTVENISYDGTSVVATAFDAATVLLRVVSTTDCYIDIGATPVASSSTILLIAGVQEYFRIASGDALAVIRSKTNGILSISQGVPA